MGGMLLHPAAPVRMILLRYPCSENLGQKYRTQREAVVKDGLTIVLHLRFRNCVAQRRGLPRRVEVGEKRHTEIEALDAAYARFRERLIEELDDVADGERALRLGSSHQSPAGMDLRNETHLALAAGDAAAAD